jgi:RNA polymerase sigma factor for flagellar operon FliA
MESAVRIVKRYKCSRCQELGHNARSCQEESPSTKMSTKMSTSVANDVVDRPTATVLLFPAAREPAPRPGDELAVTHMRWAEIYARRQAKKYPILDVDEVASEAILTLLLAARDFDQSLGVPFKAWAGKHINWAIVDMRRKEDPAGRWQRKCEKTGVETKASRRGLPWRMEGDISDLMSNSKVAVAIAMTPDQLTNIELEQVLGKISLLPPRLRDVLERHFVDGVLLHVIGAELGVTESRVCQMVQEGRRLLLELLAEPEEMVRQGSSEELAEARKQDGSGSEPPRLTASAGHLKAA